MFGVNCSYRELRGFQPLELSDITCCSRSIVHSLHEPQAHYLLINSHSLGDEGDAFVASGERTPSKRSLRKLNS